MARAKKDAPKGMVGSKLSMSPGSHEGKRQTEFDDMISLGYIFIELCFLTFPWENLDFADVYVRKTHWDAIIVSLT